MKKLLLIISVILCFAFLTGCFSSSEGPAEQPAPAGPAEGSSVAESEGSASVPETFGQEKGPDTKEPETDEDLSLVLDYNVYADAMYSLVIESLIELEEIEDGTERIERCQNMQETVPAMHDILSSETYYYYINGNASGYFKYRLGYILKDINNDGMDEMIIGTDLVSDHITPFMIYTFDGHMVRDILRDVTDEYGVPAEIDGIAENGVIFGILHDQVVPKKYYVFMIKDRCDLDMLEEFNYIPDEGGDPFEGYYIDTNSGGTVDYENIQKELYSRYAPYTIEEDEWIILTK